MPLAAARVRMGGGLSSAIVFVALFLLQDAPTTGSPWVGATFLEVLFLKVEGVVLGVGVLTTVKGVGGTIGARVLVLVVVVTVTPSSSVLLFY